MDTGGKITRVNEAWLAAAGTSGQSPVGKPLEEILGKAARKQLAAVFSKTAHGKVIELSPVPKITALPPASHYEWRPVREDGRTAGAVLLALPSGLRPRDRRKDELLRDITSGSTSFSLRMSELRKSLGIPLARLARKAGRARGYISNVESGKVIPSFEVMSAIADILDPDGEEDLLLAGIITKIPPDLRRHLPWI